MICDSHVHFFSPGFFRGLGAPPDAIAGLGWDDPVSPEALADRWVAELARHAVARAALIASSPGDVDSVAVAITRHPSRFVGFFMLDPARADAIAYGTHGLNAGMRTICLFPAMNKVPLQDPRVTSVFELAATRPGTAVFVHCGELSVGVRKRLGVPSPFDMSLGNPTHVTHLALNHPEVPIIIPHFGGGMLDEVMTLAKRCPNVHLDTSSSNSWIDKMPKALSLAHVFNHALEIVGPDRLLFGTDSSFFPRGWNREVYDAQDAALDRLNVGAEVRAKIFRGNFDRLFAA
jgi:predicted TIM-barrel fold metal-dependent hydrolase